MSTSDDLSTAHLWAEFIGGSEDKHYEEDLFSDSEPDLAELLFDPLANLRHFDVVLPNLIVGGDDYMVEAEKLDHLLALGVTHSLDCRTEYEWLMDKEYHAFTQPHRRLDLTTNRTDDDGRHKPLGYFFKAISWAARVLAETPDAVLYVHCAMGINRGPSNALAIMQGVMGMTDVEAMTALRIARPRAGAIYWKDVNRDVAFVQAVQAARDITDLSLIRKSGR